VLCSSVAADGSDFVLSGTSSTIAGATTTCTDNVTTAIKLTLSAPISTAGTYSVSLKKGTDGNTVINQCSIETPEGGSVSFPTQDTVSAAFSYAINYGCKADTGIFYHKGGNGINKWDWSFSDNGTS